MCSFRVVPIPAAAADEVRATLRAPRYGHPAHVEMATGYGPCRACLRTFRTGEEERVLFTWNAFEGQESYPSPGPVFIHHDRCEHWQGDGFPPGLRDLPMVLEGYAQGRWPVTREPATGDAVEDAIGRLFANPAISYLHVRNAEAGCYIARVERG